MERLTTEQRLTQEQLEAIRKRAEAATEGKWLPLYGFDGEASVVAPVKWHGVVASGMYDYDAEFISKSREDIPALLAEVEAQESQIQRLAQDWSAVVDERNSLLAEVERLRAELSIIQAITGSHTTWKHIDSALGGDSE